MSGIGRPKTAGSVGSFQKQQQLLQHELPAATVGRLPRRPGSQMSLRAAAADVSTCWPQYVPIRRVPSAMRRNIEIQTEAHPQPAPALGVSSGGSQQGAGEPVSGGGALFYPYYVPGMQDQQQQQQPFVLLSPWQLPGYQNLPVLDPSQLRLLDAMMKPPVTVGAHPLDGAPIYRSGRNGSCWRHIRQCTGNLGNNIMFLDGHVKEEDCRRFPPHGYPGASAASGLSVYGRLAPKSQPRIASGIPLGFPSGGAARHPAGISQALERAKSGNKYWFEDKKPSPLVPNTIQGRVMKSGSAY